MVLASCALLALAFVDGVAFIWFGTAAIPGVLLAVLMMVIVALALAAVGVRLAHEDRDAPVS